MARVPQCEHFVCARFSCFFFFLPRCGPSVCLSACLAFFVSFACCFLSPLWLSWLPPPLPTFLSFLVLFFFYSTCGTGVAVAVVLACVSAPTRIPVMPVPRPVLVLSISRSRPCTGVHLLVIGSCKTVSANLFVMWERQTWQRLGSFS